MSKLHKKWWEVYANDEEKKFFVGKDGHSGLVRNPDFHWRSTEALSREAGLTKARIEQIIDKYHKAGIVVQHEKDPEKWGYWENVASKAATNPKGSVVDEDQKDRIDKAKKKV
jgi:predicted transcriptional regulator